MIFSEITLCKNVPLDADYTHTLSFLSLDSQKTTISSFAHAYFNNQTYTRIENKVTLQIAYSNSHFCNYAICKNTNDSKTYYFFIKKCEYVNPNTTSFEIDLDILQTYYFNYSFGSCFVEREHVTDDRIGINTVPEGLETGELVAHQDLSSYWKYGDSTANLPFDQSVILATNINPQTGEEIYGNVQNNMYSGAAYFSWNFPQEVDNLNEAIKLIVAAGKEDAIISIFIMPNNFVARDPESGQVVLPTAKTFLRPPVPTTIGNYTPKNNKLFTSPYFSIYVSNKQGQSNTLDIGHFNSLFDDVPSINFQAISSVSESAKPLLVPLEYDGKVIDFTNAIALAGFVQCSFSTDTYAAWLAQSGTGWAINTASSAAAGLQSGGVAGGVGGIISSMVAPYQKMIEPPSFTGNSGGATTLQTFGLNWFEAFYMGVKIEYARQIDDFFTAFGYKVNKIKVPEIRTRPFFNYLKLKNIYLKGEISQDVENQIKEIFENGITFWHSVAAVGNYDVDNGVI